MREDRRGTADPGDGDDGSDVTRTVGTDDGDVDGRVGTDVEDDVDGKDTAGDGDVERAGLATGKGGDDADGDDPEVPEEVVSEAERLSRLAADAAVEAEAEVYRERREEVVGEHDFTARVRDEDDTLVLYPEEWVEDGVVQVDRIEDTDRAVEVSLSGPNHGAEWAAVEADNEAIVDAVAEEHGPTHAANVRAFADFMSNHYLKRVDEATEAEREEFLTEYYPRNAWPSAEQAAVVEESLRLAAETVGGTSGDPERRDG